MARPEMSATVIPITTLNTSGPSTTRRLCWVCVSA